MVILDFDGKEVKWNFAKYYDRKNRAGKSKYHIQARELLKELFPNHTIYEEVTIPTNPKLYADFFIPSKYLFIEVHGEQHYTFNSFFFKNKLEFYKAKARDKKKLEWCSLNDMNLIVLPYNESKEWQTIILNSMNQY